MKNRVCGASLVFSLVAMAPAAFAADAPGAAAPAAAVGPKIQFETTVHDFGHVQSGEQVKYTFVFTNTGDQTLEVSSVHACGCITFGNWTRTVKPGETGTIPLNFNSTGYGAAVMKPINVTCNDRTNGHPMLQFKGVVWKPIDVAPPYAVLNIPADAPSATTTVHVASHLEEPITLSEPQGNNPSFSAEVKTTVPGKEFEVVVTATPPFKPGDTRAQFSIKTSSTNTPVINFMAIANVQPLITVSPPHINLPAGPLQNPVTQVVNIVNNSSKLLELSDPTVNAGGVDVQLKQIEAGHRYAATLTFPPGFAVASGERVQLSIKSSQPNTPVLSVPIVQMMRPNGLNRLQPGTRIPPPAPAVAAPQPPAAH